MTLQIAKNTQNTSFLWWGKVMELRSLPFGIAVALRSTALLQFTEIENKSPAFFVSEVGQGGLQSPNLVKRRNSQRVALVGKQTRVSKWESVTTIITPFNSRMNGCRDREQISGLWLDEEKFLHQNQLELKPAMLAVHSYDKNLQNKNILL